MSGIAALLLMYLNEEVSLAFTCMCTISLLGVNVSVSGTGASKIRNLQ